MKIPQYFHETRHRLGLLADVGQDAAVNVEDVTVDEVGGVGGQEHGGAAQVVRLAPALSGGLGGFILIFGKTNTVM